MNSDLNQPGQATSLKDFQAFISELLKEENQKSGSGIKALTHGLGLESPKVTLAPKPMPKPVEQSKPVEKTEPVEKPRPVVRRPKEELLNLVTTPSPALVPPPIPNLAPPPLPAVSLIKRASSLMLDQIFVQTLWVIALVITSNIFSGFETGLSSNVFRGFSDPLFFRFAILEFATLWLAYLAISLGIFNMTFGMWVWGIRISYGDKKDENYGLRKLMRIFWSFIFYAPVLPSVLLGFKSNDRNLLDTLSGSNLYLVQ